MIKFPLHSGTAWGGINKAVEHKLSFCPMLSCLDKSFADTLWKGQAWGISVIGHRDMRHIFAQFQNLVVELSVTFAADDNSLS